MLIYIFGLYYIFGLLKKIYFIVTVLFCTNFNAQEGLPLYSDYLTDNYFLVHPAMAGAELFGGKARMTARKQWFDQENAPELQTFSTAYRFSDRSGVGAVLFNDKNGYYSTKGFQLTYAHHILFDDKAGSCSCFYPNHENPINQLSFGLSVGMTQNALDQTSFDLTIFDPLITGVRRNIHFLNMDVGVSYLRSNFFAHFTIKNLLFSPHNLYGDFNYPYNRSSTNYRKLIASAGLFLYTEKTWIFEPSALFQYSETTQEKFMDINFKAYYNLEKGRIWSGVSYRFGFENASFVISHFQQKVT